MMKSQLRDFLLIFLVFLPYSEGSDSSDNNNLGDNNGYNTDVSGNNNVGDDYRYHKDDKLDCNPTTEFTCDTGECIRKDEQCDGDLDCLDGSDEYLDNCKRSCNSDEWICDDGQCIGKDYKCNGILNCIDDSDESPHNCVKSCPMDQQLTHKCRCGFEQCQAGESCAKFTYLAYFDGRFDRNCTNNCRNRCKQHGTMCHDGYPLFCTCSNGTIDVDNPLMCPNERLASCTCSDGKVMDERNVDSKLLTGSKIWLEPARGMCGIDGCAGNNCSCNDFVNDNGYGQCKKAYSRLSSFPFCYVNIPSDCNDLVDSKTDPGKFISFLACGPGTTSNTTSNTTTTLAPITPSDLEATINTSHWNVIRATDCYNGAGAYPIYPVPYDNLITLLGCMAKCLGVKVCEGIVVNAFIRDDFGKCWLIWNITIWNCNNNQMYNTYLKPGIDINAKVRTSSGPPTFVGKQDSMMLALFILSSTITFFLI